MIPQADDLQAIRGYLQASHVEYFTDEPLGSGRLNIWFTGSYVDKDVLWKCRLYTLQQYHEDYIASARIDVDQPARLRQFIEVGPNTGEYCPLTVGVNLPEIDHSTVLKTIVMIRNYKSLKQGRHEFGAVIDLQRRKS